SGRRRTVERHHHLHRQWPESRSCIKTETGPPHRGRPCGYPISSLKERIYASGAGQPDRFGILIYTSTAGAQGTLGGLSGMAEHLPEILAKVVESLELCSNDPICADHHAGTDLDERPLHGAACHACILVPETSCEARNSRLDRGLLVSTLVGSKSAIFGEIKR
ncbi:DUF1998 domain-containing protein, partial [Mesorhizobium microcysteis]